MSEDHNFEKLGKNCGSCSRNTLLPHDYEWTGLSCGYNKIKRKHELSKNQRKKINFVNRLKYAEQKFFCICVDICQITDGNDFDIIYEILSKLKKKKK